MRRSNRTSGALVAIALLGAACSGAVGGGGGGTGSTGGVGGAGNTGGPGGGGGMPGPGMIPPGADTGAGTVALARVTLHQLNNMYRDLLGDTTAPANQDVLSADSLSDSTFYVGAGLADMDVQSLLDISDTLATNAVKDLTKLLPGQPLPATAAAQADWAKQFIQVFGRRAFRRPLVADEAADLLALYQQQIAPPISATFPNAVEAVLAAMLMAPAFLYRWELGPQ